MTRVLVTGASGQLARPIAARLRENGFEPVLLARTKLADAPAIVLGAPWHAEALAALMEAERIEAIVHLAAAGVRPGAVDGGDLFEANVALPVALLRAGGGRVRAMINIGSGSEYAGIGRDPLDEDAPLTTSHPYGLSKAAAALSARLVAGSLGIGFAHLRLFGAYGEHEAPHRLLPNLVRRLPAGAPVDLSDGLQVRDWLYEPDIADAVTLTLAGLMAGEVESGIYNLGSGTGHSVREFATIVADLLGAPAELLRFGAIARRPGEIERIVADPRRLMACIGWQPRYRLAAGLAESIGKLRSGV